MIEFLDRLSPLAPGTGRAGADLLALRAAGVAVVPTIVCETALFGAFRAPGRIGSGETERLSVLLAAPDFASSARCVVRVSTDRPYPGLAADAVVESSVTAVKHAVERVYRSWSSDRARAARMARKIGDEDGAPAILIQSEHAEPDVLLSRVSATGKPTDAGNVADTVQNAVREFRSDHADLLHRAERALRRPVLLQLTADALQVLTVSECPLTSNAELAVATEFFQRGWLNPAEFILRVEPRQYMESGAVVPSPSPKHEVQGLGVSPGIGLGRLFFRGGPPEAGVLALNECSPEDVAQMFAATAVISQHGGKAGHCAVVCRGFGKPAVTLDSVKVDGANRRLVLPGGAVVPEGAFAMADGATGRVYFSDQEFSLGTGVRATSGTQDGIDALLVALEAVGDGTSLQALPEDVQTRVGLHRRYLRELGLR